MLRRPRLLMTSLPSATSKLTSPAWKPRRAGSPIGMTAQEYKLLRFLSQSPEHVMSREELFNEVWGYQNYPSTRTVDNHILRLRQKLEPDPANPRFFVTVHGAGYKFVPGGSGAGKKS